MDLIFIFGLLGLVIVVFLYSYIKEADEIDDDCYACPFADSEFCQTKCKNK